MLYRVPRGALRGSGVGLDLIARARRAGVACDMAYRGNMKKRMQRANSRGAILAVIIGDEELAKGVVAAKNLSTGEQHDIPLGDLEEQLYILGFSAMTGVDTAMLAYDSSFGVGFVGNETEA